ncbi:hypothetical protein NE237_016327 [Protea cynaroides]|uniref:Uncharacterized protein n=1 Tax=Protea cynaroides TaxID=273540 RepID=A0A9Q0GNL2_9MAGN|nr:hypothetical protein NE237_016327 [Protea cynaroides]
MMEKPASSKRGNVKSSSELRFQSEASRASLLRFSAASGATSSCEKTEGDHRSAPAFERLSATRESRCALAHPFSLLRALAFFSWLQSLRAQ